MSMKDFNVEAKKPTSKILSQSVIYFWSVYNKIYIVENFLQMDPFNIFSFTEAANCDHEMPIPVSRIDDLKHTLGK